MFPNTEWDITKDYTCIVYNGNFIGRVEGILTPSDICSVSAYGSGNYEIATWEKFSNYWKRTNFLVFSKD